MQGHSLLRHYQDHLQVQDVQGWHPHTIVRWLFFILPLLYMIIIQTKVFMRLLSFRQKYWVSTQSRTYHFIILLTIFELIIFGVGLYAAITDAWSTKEWVLWTALLIFIGFYLLACSTNNPYLILIVILAIVCFFFNQWLYIQTRDMYQSFWKRLVRNLIGFNAALLMFNAIINIGQVFVYVFGWTQASQARFFWIFGVLLSIGFTLLNGLVYGPFYDAIGFIVGCIVCFISAYLFQTHQFKDKLVRH